MAVFSALTGLRFSDVVTLKWEDVYEDSHQGHYIQFREQKQGQIFIDIKYSQITRPLKKMAPRGRYPQENYFSQF